jgi:hypothetical protein
VKLENSYWVEWRLLWWRRSASPAMAGLVGTDEWVDTQL